MKELPPTLQIFQAAAEDAGQRVDRWLAARLPEASRTRIQEAIAAGRVRVAGRAARPSLRIRTGQSIEIELMAEPPREAAPEPIPLDILYEDDDLIAVNKTAGLIVHPGAGGRAPTVAGGLLHRYGRLSSLGGPSRPGIVHRLDKDTSGVLLVARNDAAHIRLAREFAARQIGKTYLALLHGRLAGETGRIALPIARDLRRRTRMTTRRREGRAALTTWRVLARIEQGRDKFTLVEAELHTGRTHQLRVHFSAIGHPVAGDTRYGAPRRILVAGEPAAPLGRLWLHAWRVRLAHPRTDQPIEIRAAPAAELREWLGAFAQLLGKERWKIDRVLEAFL
ncbi:MAG TPA: RluA family pseudouridine synthase [Patescibacteria group bacterium]|nr:RluA family pseudouridine synthase [Patescibacteria group bacterium]